MSAFEELRQRLTTELQVSPEVANAVVESCEPIAVSGKGQEFEALIVTKGLGDAPHIISRSGWNMILNWRDLLWKVAPTAVGAGVAMAVEPYSGAIIALSVIPTILDTGTIKLSKEHGAVVLTLWTDFDGQSTVEISDLKSLLPRDISDEKLKSILDDLKILRVIKVETDKVTKRDRLIVTEK